MNSERDIPLTVFKPHVQIYAIVEQGSDDYQLLGHGFVSIIRDQIENETVHYLEVASVKDGEVLLRSRLKLNNNYQKQRGSVIVWSDNQHRFRSELAISFETAHQCDIFWYHRRLICEKIGKNYLEISGRDPLQLPTQNNLAYILQKTKTSKDLVEYNLLNNPAFPTALFKVFKKFQNKGDKMGQGMVGRIVKSIFNNPDYKMIQALFQDPTFDLILQVQKFLQQIDFPLFWAQKLKIKTIIPLSEQLTNKIRIIHRLNFYRESIMDLMRENNLQQMLVMTHLQFSKDIVLHLTKDDIIDEIVKITYQNTQDQLLLLSSSNKDIAQEETFLSESEDLKKLQFAQKKMQFLLEALIMSKQIQDQNARIRFVDKLYKSKVLEMASQYLDRGVYRAIDFLICLAQSSPFKFIEYLKVKYRQCPTDNLHIKLCKKYNLGNEQMQNLILQIVRYTSQSFRNRDNMDFFNGTFFALVFGGCKDQKAVLNVLGQVQNNIENIESFFGQAIKSKVFEKLAMFLRSQKQEKCTELRAIKILKRVLLQNADSSWSFKKVFLEQLNNEIINSGFFEYCIMVLQKNLRFNNIVCSSMLQNLKIISQINRFTKFHKLIQKNYSQLAPQISFISKILQVKQEIPQNNGIQDEQPVSHQKQLEQEKEQAYFLQQMQEEGNVVVNNTEQQQQLQNLRKMRREISQQEKSRQDSELSMLSQPSKKVKKNSQFEEQPIMIQLDLALQDIEGEK